MFAPRSHNLRRQIAMSDTTIFFTLIALVLLCLLGIGASQKGKHDDLVNGCRDAGGALVGEICIIRSDCASMNT